MANPTAREQELLELINRMRMDPTGELALLGIDTDPNIKLALDKFKVNQTTLKTQFDRLKSVAPLAWSSQLNTAALNHNAKMIARDVQAHQVGTVSTDADGTNHVIMEQDKDANGNLIPGKYHVANPDEPLLAGRLTAVQYDYSSGRENIYSYAKSIAYAHAGFAIDWGADDPATSQLDAIDGIQNPTGHRDAMMATDVREVGISVTDENNPKTQVGDLVITQNFGNRQALNGKAWLLGVAFQDTNTDGWYQAGEGLNDVRVQITGINGTTFSDTISVGDAGGYQELLDPGEYQVDFIRNGTTISRRMTSIDAKAPDNVKVDFILPVMTLGSDPLGASSGEMFGTNLQTSGSEGKVFDFSIDNTHLSDPKLAPTTTVAVNFVGVTAEAAYHNYGGLYRVEDASGTVMDTDGKLYKPGETGYLSAALRRSKASESGTQLDRGDLKGDTNLQGGYIYAPFVVADGTVDDVLNGKSRNVFFNYKAANADGLEHFKLLGSNKLSCEDTLGGGDRDFNDLVFQVNAKVV